MFNFIIFYAGIVYNKGFKNCHDRYLHLIVGSNHAGILINLVNVIPNLMIITHNK